MPPRSVARHALRGLLLACTIVALSACATARAARPPGTLVVLYSSDADTLDPLYTNNEPAFLFYTLVFDALSGVGPGFRYVPQLATGWTSTPDHLHWDVALRHGVRWHDGAAFDARDVLFTWKAVRDPAVGYLYGGQFTYVARVTARDPFHVRFDLSAPNVLFVSQALNVPILPAHLLATIPPGQLRRSAFGQHPVGTGPYRLERWRHDESITFRRNPTYWNGAPTIDRLVFRIVLNNDARIDAMIDGSADMYLSMAPADYRTLRRLAPQLHYYHAPGLNSRFILVNDTRPGLDDLSVRRAMMYGWDRRAVADGLYHGDVRINDTLTAWALGNWHADGLTSYPYDPARARALLDAAGWRVGPDGIRRRGGIRLAFTLENANGDAVLANVGVAFQADMRAVGIAVDIQQLDYATFNDRLNAMRYELALSGWGGVDPDQETFLDSSQIVPVGNNETGYRNARVDRDLRAGLRAFDPARRRALYDDYERIVSATVPVLWGFDEAFNAAYTPRVVIDPRLALPGYYFFWNVATWSLRS